mgnify:CR=1 FL=1
MYTFQKLPKMPFKTYKRLQLIDLQKYKKICVASLYNIELCVYVKIFILHVLSLKNIIYVLYANRILLC